jgi:hypothetical protein
MTLEIIKSPFLTLVAYSLKRPDYFNTKGGFSRYGRLIGNSHLPEIPVTLEAAGLLAAITYTDHLVHLTNIGHLKSKF